MIRGAIDRMWRTPLVRYLLVLLWCMPWRVLAALVLMVGYGLSEGLGILLLVALLQAVGVDAEGGGVGAVAEGVSSAFETVWLSPTLAWVLVVLTMLMAARAVVYRWQVITTRGLEYGLTAHLRSRLYGAILRTNWLFFARLRGSNVVHPLTAEIDRVGVATRFLMNALVAGVVATVYLLLALRLSAATTGVVFACAAGLLWLLRERTQEARTKGEEVSAAGTAFHQTVREHLGGLKTVKSYASEDRTAHIFTEATGRMTDQYLDATRAYADVQCGFDIGSVVAFSVTVFLAVSILALPPAGVLLLVFLFIRMAPRVSALQQNLHDFVETLPAFTRVVAMIDTWEAAAEHPPSVLGSVLATLDVGEGVRFDGVSFGYRDDEPLAVSDVSLVCRAGQTTAIVGPPGAGKSTIADLAMGLLAPSSGQVLVNQSPLIEDRRRAWRNFVGYVPQEGFLFDDTVDANLRWASPEVSLDEVYEALRLADAYEFVDQLPEGLGTTLGGRGQPISGGERQRLTLARALLRRPRVLVFDEAMSNVDAEDEARILRVIEHLHGRLTILIVTHRLSTIRSADMIYFVEHGRVLESGSWKDLIAESQGRFRALCMTQGIDVGPAPVSRVDARVPRAGEVGGGTGM